MYHDLLIVGIDQEMVYGFAGIILIDGGGVFLVFFKNIFSVCCFLLM